MNRCCDNAYTPDAVLAEIFTGDDAVEREQCRSELAALGHGPRGNRLRELFRRLIVLMQTRTYTHHGCMIYASGRPMSFQEIAVAVVWDASTIEQDLRELANVGLMQQQVLQNVGGCN